MSDSVTILRTTGRRQLAKTIAANGDIAPYPQAKTFDLYETSISHIGDLHQLLRQLDQRGDCAVVRGKPAAPERCRGVRRLLYSDRQTGEPATLVEVPRHWLALDFDNLPRPEWIDPTDLLGCAVVAIRRLPSVFQKAAFVVQATASHGLKPGIRLRLWAWLDRPLTGTELKWWLRKAPVDRAVFSTAQIIYTAAPVFLSGAFDPLAHRIDVIPGHDMVAVPPANLLKRPELEKYRVRGDHHQTRTISGLIRLVETARLGNRSNALYWAACRLAENPDIDQDAAAADLEDAAIRAGLPAKEAADTVKSGLRQGSAHG
jgi:hypothetical protein